LSSCVTIWPVTGVFGASVAFGACGDGAVVCASAGVNPSASSKAIALAPVLSVIINLHLLRARGAFGGKTRRRPKGSAQAAIARRRRRFWLSSQGVAFPCLDGECF